MTMTFAIIVYILFSILTTRLHAQNLTFSTTPAPTPTTPATPTASTHNVTLTDTSTNIDYGSGGVCTAASCSANATVNPWIATWGQDNVTTEYFTFHATNQALARESGGIPYLTFNFNGTAIYLYVITSLSSRGVFNVTTDGGTTYTTVYQNVTTSALRSDQLAWSQTGLDPTVEHNLILRFWADAHGTTTLNGVDANGASLNIQDFVVVEPGPENTSTTSSTSSTSSSSTSSSSTSSNSADLSHAIYAASNRTSLILGLCIGLPLFFIFLVLCLILLLCIRRRRHRSHSQLDDEKSHTSSWFLGLGGGNTSRGHIPSRYRGGRSWSNLRPGARAGQSASSFTNGAGGTAAAAAAAGGVAGAAAKGRQPRGQESDDLDDSGGRREMSSEALYGQYPGYSPRAEDPQPQTTPNKKTIGPLLVPRETASPTISPTKGQLAEPLPFVLGLGGESKREARQRRRNEMAGVGGSGKPPSVESNMGGSSGEQGGEESEADTTPSQYGAEDVVRSAAHAPAGAAGRPSTESKGYDSHALSSDDGHPGQGRGKKKESAQLSMAAAIAAGLVDLPKDSSPKKKSSAHSQLRDQARNSVSSSVGTGGGFVNALDVPPVPPLPPTSVSHSHSHSNIRVSSPRFDAPLPSPRAQPPRIRTELLFPGQDEHSRDYQASDLDDVDVFRTGIEHHSAMPSPGGLFYDTFAGNGSGKPTPQMRGFDSPIASTPEPMPKSPLEYFNESQARILGMTAAATSSTSGALGVPESSATRRRDNRRSAGAGIGGNGNESGNGSASAGRARVGLGLASPAPTEED